MLSGDATWLDRTTFAFRGHSCYTVGGTTFNETGKRDPTPVSSPLMLMRAAQHICSARYQGTTRGLGVALLHEAPRTPHGIWIFLPLHRVTRRTLSDHARIASESVHTIRNGPGPLYSGALGDVVS